MTRTVYSNIFVSITLLLIASSKAAKTPFESPPDTTIPVGNPEENSQKNSQENPQSQVGKLFSIPPHEIKPCEEWETIPLALQDVDVKHTGPNPYDAMVKIKAESNLKGRVIPFPAEFYDWNVTARSARACACGVVGSPCIPLCCEADQQASFKGDKLTCTNQTIVDNKTSVVDEFAKHLMTVEKLKVDKFIIVHHRAQSLSGCPNHEMSYKLESTNGGHQINENGNLQTTEDGGTHEAKSYCFLLEKTGNKSTFVPIFCLNPSTKPGGHQTKSDDHQTKPGGHQTKPSGHQTKSGGYQMTPITFIIYPIASIILAYVAFL